MACKLEIRPQVYLTLAITLIWLSIGAIGLRAPSALAAPTAYARAGWTAELSTLAHGVDGVAEIIDERTIVLRNFAYDGGGPAVYAYLAAEESNSAFANGLSMRPLLTRSGQPYANATITLTLPSEEVNLDAYHAISIWCEDFKVNFGSGLFAAPVTAPPLADKKAYLPVIFANQLD